MYGPRQKELLKLMLRFLVWDTVDDQRTQDLEQGVTGMAGKLNLFMVCWLWDACETSQWRCPVEYVSKTQDIDVG